MRNAKCGMRMVIELLDQLFAFCFQRSPPQFAIGGKASYEHIELIALSVGEVSVVRKAFDIRLKPGSGLQRWPLGRTVKEDIKVDLQLADIVFHPRKLLIDVESRFMFRFNVSI